MTTVGLQRSLGPARDAAAPADAKPVDATPVDAKPVDAKPAEPAADPNAKPAADLPAKPVVDAQARTETRTRFGAGADALRAQLEAKAAALRVPTEVLTPARRAVDEALKGAMERKADTVELSRVVHQTAVDEINRAAPHASPQERADAAMAVASFAILGKDQNENLASVDSGRTSMMKYLRELTSGEDGDKYREPKDPTKGKGDLEPRFDDDTVGQAFHIGFFLAAGYVSSGNPVKQGLVMGAAVYHETVEPGVFKGGGNTRADYVASMYGAIAGERMKQARDRGNGDAIPAMVVGLMAKNGAETKPTGLTPERDAIAQKEAAAVREDRDSWLNRAAIDFHPQVNALIGGVQLAQKIWNR